MILGKASSGNQPLIWDVRGAFLEKSVQEHKGLGWAEWEERSGEVPLEDGSGTQAGPTCRDSGLCPGLKDCGELSESVCDVRERDHK